MYYVMRASAPSLHRESTDSLIYIPGRKCTRTCARYYALNPRCNAPVFTRRIAETTRDIAFFARFAYITNFTVQKMVGDSEGEKSERRQMH